MAKDVLEPAYIGSRVRWGAVFAGLLIAMVTQILLGLLGLAVGLTAFTPGEADPGLGIGSSIWLVISTLISVFVGAMVASWWANVPYRIEGVLHGVLTWSLFLIVTLFLIGSGIGNLIGGAFNLMAAGVTGAAQGVATGTPDMMTREQAIDVITENTNLTEQQARQLLEGQGLQEREVAQQVTETATQIAWWSFVALLLSLIAGALGGLLGGRNRYIRHQA